MIVVYIYSIVAAYIIAAIVAGIHKANKMKDTRPEEKEREETWEEVCRRVRESDEAEKALRTAYDGIRKQNAAGLGLYIPSLLHRAFEGEDITKEETATALRLTYFDIMKHAPRAEDFAESTREDIMRRYDYAWLLTIAESLV